MGRWGKGGMVVAWTVACGGKDPGLVELSPGKGQACVYGEGGVNARATTRFEAGRTTEIVVTFERCATGCATEVKAACEAALDGDRIVVTGSASYDTPDTVVACPAVCVPVVARCAGPTLPAGAWTVVWGAPGDTLTVPSPDGAVPCSP